MMTWSHIRLAGKNIMKYCIPTDLLCLFIIESAGHLLFYATDPCLGWFANILKIWALQDGTTVVVGGKTNRAKGEFPAEMNRLLDRVPELLEKSKTIHLIA